MNVDRSGSGPWHRSVFDSYQRGEYKAYRTAPVSIDENLEISEDWYPPDACDQCGETMIERGEVGALRPDLARRQIPPE